MGKLVDILKPPEVFEREDFPQYISAESAAHIANNVLAQKLKPWYGKFSDDDGETFISGIIKEQNDTHVMWSLEPQKLGLLTMEFTLERAGVDEMPDLEKFKDKKVRVTIEEVR